DPSGRFLYVLNYNSAGLAAYSIDPSSGSLTLVPGSPFGGLGKSVAVDPKGRFVFVGGFTSVEAYTISVSTGGLTPVAGSPFPSGPFNYVSVDPAGKFVYVLTYCNCASPNSIYAYGINGTSGALTAVPGSPFVTGGTQGPAGPVAVDPTGTFAYVA